MYDVMLNK